MSACPVTIVVIPILPVLGNVIIELLLSFSTYPLDSDKVGLLKNTVPEVEVNLALYNFIFKSSI